MRELISTFKDMSPDLLYKMLRARQEVFILEQDCPYVDVDLLDLESIHYFILEVDEIVAYARILPPGLQYEHNPAIGRILTSKTYRRQGLGKQLVKRCLEISRESWPGKPIKISAQVYLLKLYESLGFSAKGETYLEDGIPHVAMLSD